MQNIFFQIMSSIDTVFYFLLTLQEEGIRFVENFDFLKDVYLLEVPEYDMTVFRNWRSACVCISILDTNFVWALFNEE